MSAYSAYAARSERITSTLRTESADLLNMIDLDAPGDGFPISGDMLAILKRDTRGRAIWRRMFYRSFETGAEL